MISKLFETLTGKDDVERVAYKDDPQLLANYLKTRRLFFPKRPLRYLDAATFMQDELLQLIEQESKELSAESVELWILDIDGKKRLPAFSSQKKNAGVLGENVRELKQGILIRVHRSNAHGHSENRGS